MDSINLKNVVKKLTIRFAVIFFIILAILTYFSKSINYVLLPKVSVTVQESGALSDSIREKSKLEYTDKKVFDFPCDTVLKEIFVSKGDKIKKGDRLANIENISYKTVKSELELNILKLENSIKYLDAESYKVETYAELDQIELQIKEDKNKLEIMQSIYDMFLDKTDEDGNIIAVEDGIVTDINVKTNEPISKNQTLINYALLNSKMCFSWNMPKEKGELFPINNSVNIQVDIMNMETGESRKAFGLTKINKKVFDENTSNYIFTSNFPDLKLSENEQYPQAGTEVSFFSQITSEEYDSLVLKSAVRDLGKQKIMYVVRDEANGEHFIKQLEVNILDSNDFYCAIDTKLQYEEKIVISSSKPIKDGDRVLFEGE